MVMPLMGADLNSIIKTQKLSDDHIQVSCLAVATPHPGLPSS